MNIPLLFKRSLRAGSRSAFTLVELLIVVVIISMLLALVVPATSSVSKANQISMGVQMVVDTLSLARQTALTQNRVVEVRFYKYTSLERTADKDEIAALQAFVYDETNSVATPVGEIQHLPNGAVISDANQFSSLVTASRLKSWTAGDQKTSLPRGVGENYTAYRLRYRPDGATDLGAGEWYLTVHGTDDVGSPPANHAAIQIDPYNGSLRLYRPG